MPQNDSSQLSRRRWMQTVAAPAVGGAIAAGMISRSAAAAAAPDTATSAADANLAGLRVFNIRDFGAKGDGTTLDTAAVQAAIDACTKDQGGTVLVPAGTFVIGTVELKSNVTLHLAAAAKLLGSGHGADYHAVDAIPLHGDSTLEDGHVALLFAVNAENITIEGNGVIDGNGALFHSRVRGEPPASGIGGARRPYSLLFYRCPNLLLRDFRLLNSAFHAIRIIQSSYTRADGLHIHSRVNSNNDGFHFISAQHVNLTNCNVECQDDACALFGSCQFISVTNCSFSTRWSVFRFGGGNASNITVSNCLIYQAYGCPIKIRCGAGSVFQDMSFSNLIMQDVTGPISIGVGPQPRRRSTSQPAAPSSGAADEPTTQPIAADQLPILRRISFSNIRATVPATPGQLPGQPFHTDYRPGEIRSCIVLNGVQPAVLQDISLTDVHVIFGGGGTADEAARRDVPQRAGEYFELGTLPAYGIYARNVRGLTLSNVRLSVDQPDARPAIVLDNVEDAAVTGLTVQASPAAESALRLINSKQVLVTAPRMLGQAAVFLRAEGSNTADVIVNGGDLSRAQQPGSFADGASPEGVHFET